jgi:serine/threonine protein phosphatase 1
MTGFFKSLWGSVSKPSANAAAVPDHTRLYVVGDIHGCSDLLVQMHELIWEDLQKSPIEFTTEVYIGDYIDRGPDSCGVIEILCASPALCNQRICLMGNHEQILLDFIANPATLTSWMELGGLETLSSYGLRPKRSLQSYEVGELHAELLERMPSTHDRFFRNLPYSFPCGGYFIVHAGVKPGVSLAQQKPDDLLWIRDPFLTSTRNFGAVVVHGHTPGTEPVILPNRICIDTGAYLTGVLTCLVLEGREMRFLSTSQRHSARKIA